MPEILSAERFYIFKTAKRIKPNIIIIISSSHLLTFYLVNISNTNLDANIKFEGQFFYDHIRLPIYQLSCVTGRKLSNREIKLSTKPRISKRILIKVKYRDKFYSKIIKSKQPNPNLLLLYKKFRNSVVKYVKVSKSNYLIKELLSV